MKKIGFVGNESLTRNHGERLINVGKGYHMVYKIKYKFLIINNFNLFQKLVLSYYKKIRQNLLDISFVSSEFI